MTAKNSSNSLVPATQTSPNVDYANFDEGSQYLTFSLNQELYAFGILHVKEILEYGKVTKVPMMPEFIEGVINLRGEVIPVVNLARRFGLPASVVTRRTCIVIVEINAETASQVIGVMVDSVSEVLEIDSENLRNAPSFGAAIRTDFIQAMGKIEEDFVIILAEDKVLSIEEMALMEQVREFATEEHIS